MEQSSTVLKWSGGLQSSVRGTFIHSPAIQLGLFCVRVSSHKGRFCPELAIYGAAQSRTTTEAT